MLIVAILAAVMAPMILPPVNKAKWTEGRAGAGALASGIRAYCTETEQGHPGVPSGGDFTDFHVFDVDLRGKYFMPANYSVSEVVYDPAGTGISYLITVTTPGGLSGPDKTLDQNGQWNDISP